MSVTSLYEGWPRVQNHLVHGIPRLSEEQLALSAGGGTWPIWALVSHLAGARVYWLCTVFKEPGLETTPFGANTEEGWEVGSSRVDLQACKLEYSIVSPK